MKNFFEILELGKFPKIILNFEEVEEKYSKIQMKLMKNRASLSENEFEEKLDFINKAISILKDEKSRIEHAFEILEGKDFNQNEKNLIEKEVEEDNEIMEYFFEINEKIDDLFSKNKNLQNFNQNLENIKEKLILEKNQLLLLIDEFINSENFKAAYRNFLKIKYFYRTLEIIKNKETLC
jgi:hypothetical protein